MQDLLAILQNRFEIADHPLLPVAAEPERRGALDLMHLRFRTRTGDAVRGVYCRPADAPGPLPAVLVIHAHGDRYDIGCDELLAGRPALAGPVGPALASRGFATLCLDLPCFGTRADVRESAAAKAALWQGRSLAGQMLGESRAALDWLAHQPGVRADRLGVFGISMGATLGTWLGAVDRRLRAVAHACCYADFATLIATGAHDLHGIYLTIPGLLGVADNGRIAGLIAPRAQFIGIGDADPLTPPDAVDTALARTRAAYAAAGGRLTLHRGPATGHVETAAMRAAILAFLATELG